MIGALGSIVFKVSVNQVHTFQDFKRTSSGRWAKHEIHGQKPKEEFLGPDLDSISFKMELKRSLGNNPRYDMEKLMILTRTGEALPLVIGGDAMGFYRWVVKDVEQEWENIDPKGNVLSATVSITLDEYIK